MPKLSETSYHKLPKEIQWDIDHINNLTDSMNLMGWQSHICKEREDALVALQEKAIAQKIIWSDIFWCFERLKGAENNPTFGQNIYRGQH